jgi:hypothetical protein
MRFAIFTKEREEENLRKSRKKSEGEQDFG